MGPENLGYALINGMFMCVLVNNGARMTTITPAYAKVNGVRVAPVSELQDVTGAQIPMQGVGGV